MSDMAWMVCTQCRQTVVQNDIGVCLHCQHKYTRHNQPDSWDNIQKLIKSRDEEKDGR